VLALKFNERKFLQLDLEAEQLYWQILAEKKKLLPTNSLEQKFLARIPTRLLRKAAKALRENPHITRHQFIQPPIALNIDRDPETQKLTVDLHTFQPP
jgi:hypothetical protein